MRHVVFDLETTGPDPDRARIVSMAFVTLGGDTLLSATVNPLEPISAGATKVHGISDADVADSPTFLDLADDVQGVIDGAILCGYNSRRFDVPVLDRELRNAGRAGIDFGTLREVDAYMAWVAMEPRTLAGALNKWCGEEIECAHDSLADARATAKVITAMTATLEVTESIGALEALSVPEYEIDRAGKFKRCPDTGRALLNIGKHRGDYAANHTDFLRWMLGADFPEDTKKHIEGWLKSGN